MGCPLFLCLWDIFFIVTKLLKFPKFPKFPDLSPLALLDSVLWNALLMDRVGLAYDFFDI